jgi:phage terminase large subunit-like protein
MWLDEAAFIASARAWEVARPALSNKMGLVITTTTPDGKNWFYDEFWTRTFDEPNTGRVEYRSIDNPYFPSEEWKEVQRTMHPMLFKQEYLASFDSMAGKELAGDWLHYYELSAIEHLKREDGTYNMDIYIGIDPAISLADTADRFAITAIGVTKDRHQIYLIDQWAGRIPFPEQVETIYEWFQKWRPRYIAIERVAYQAALIQQTMRLPGFPPVIPYWPKGKKHERILSMAPLFRIGRILIRKDHADFINEWVDYDSQLKNPKDDCLDSFEIALRGAGVVLPGASTVVAPLLEQPPTTTDQWTSIAGKKFAALTSDQRSGFDFHLGDDW